MRALGVAALALLVACDAAPAPRGQTRLVPAPAAQPAHDDAPASTHDDAPDLGAADAAPSPWLAGGVRAGCCTDTHGLGPATIREENGALVLRLTEDVPMRCRVELGEDGAPRALRDCAMAPPWLVRTPKIPLRCSYAAGRERCAGRYRVASARAFDEGSDTVALERDAEPPPPPAPPTDAEIAARRAAWSTARLRIVYPTMSSWSGRVHVERGRLVATFDPLSNLERCTLELGDDGDASALSDCVPVNRDWAPARRRSPLRCARDDEHPGEVRCRGPFPWRDPHRTYDLPVVLVMLSGS